MVRENKESGLTVPQLMVMCKIGELDPPLAKQIAEEITLSPATVTTILVLRRKNYH